MARNSSAGDTINHLGVVTIRVIGAGNLKINAYSYQFINYKVCPTIPMATATNKIESILANFQDQKIQLEIGTTEIDETFTVSKITPYVTPVAMEYPR